MTAAVGHNGPMPIVYYPAIIERARRGYAVFSPDLPGCTSAGETVAEAAINAEEALAGHLLVSEEHGDELAAPSELHAVEVEPDIDEVARILVRGVGGAEGESERQRKQGRLMDGGWLAFEWTEDVGPANVRLVER